jgi:hypothetical protein
MHCQTPVPSTKRQAEANRWEKRRVQVGRQNKKGRVEWHIQEDGVRRKAGGMSVGQAGKTETGRKAHFSIKDYWKMSRSIKSGQCVVRKNSICWIYSQERTVTGPHSNVGSKQFLFRICHV